MKSFVPALVLAVVCVFPLAGCGQKGPLFLPGEAEAPPAPVLDNDSSADTLSPETATGADAESVAD